ncbi:MAG: hypothetical protein ACR2NR_23500, partial [Solirubrobacteraceae bacterium]
MLAVAFACGVAAEATIAGDRAARDTLAALTTSERAVTLIQQGPATSAADRAARALLAGLVLPAPTRALLLNPVRLSAVVVRPAAIDPLAGWVLGAGAPALGRCRAHDCPMLLVGGSVRLAQLRAPGVRIVVADRGQLSSAAPLGFTPTPGGQPLLVTSDAAGLGSLPALRSVYWDESWMSLPPLR